MFKLLVFCCCALLAVHAVPEKEAVAAAQQLQALAAALQAQAAAECAATNGGRPCTRRALEMTDPDQGKIYFRNAPFNQAFGL